MIGNKPIDQNKCQRPCSQQTEDKFHRKFEESMWSVTANLVQPVILVRVSIEYLCCGHVVTGLGMYVLSSEASLIGSYRVL